MGLFRGIAIFIGWLTSSIAGIAAIFYACGYLVARAQLNLLGLFGLFEHPREQYLQEGAKFLITVTVMLMGKLLPWLTLLFYLGAFLGLIVGLPLWILSARKRDFLVACREKLQSVTAGTFLDRSSMWRLFLLAALFAFLVFHVLDYLQGFAAALSISNVLYGPSPGTAGPDPAAQLLEWLFHGESQSLQGFFLHLLKGELLAVLLLIAAWHVAAPIPARFWLVTPFVVVFALYTIFTPMAYGVLVRPVRYAVVVLDWQGDRPPFAGSEFYLLNKSSQEYILWDSGEKKVLCVSVNLVRSTRVLGLRPLFSTP